MFEALQPLLAERSVHILLAATTEGRLSVYVEPVKLNDQEDKAFATPFRCEGTAQELDAELASVLTQWVVSRAAVTKSLREALSAAEAQATAAAEEAKKKAAERTKKHTTTTARTTAKAAVTKVTPSLLDGCDNDSEDTTSVTATTITPSVTPAVAMDGNGKPDASCLPTTEATPATQVATACETVAAGRSADAPVKTPQAAATIATNPVAGELF